MSLVLAIDFDGTVVERDLPLRLRRNAAPALRQLKAAGHRLVLHSCRCNPMDPTPDLPDEVERFYGYGTVPRRVQEQWERFEAMRQFLKVEQLWDLFDEIWQAPGKPIADVYVDDRAEPADWVAVVNAYGLRSAHVQPLSGLGGSARVSGSAADR